MTTSEIRARWADIGPWDEKWHPVGECWGEHFPNDKVAVIHAPTDITHLLKENERLTQLNEARKQLLVAYRTANPKLAERALTKIERLERVTDTSQPGAQQNECNRYNWRRTAELETIVDLVKTMADLGYGTPEHRSAHYAVLKAIESDAPQSGRNSDAIAADGDSAQREE